ncbi:hypothetical protein Tco_1357587 [Tanacetum coccineum]
MVVTMERWYRGDGVDVVDGDGGVDEAAMVRIAAGVDGVVWLMIRGVDDGCRGDDVGGDEPIVMSAVEGWSEVSSKNKWRQKIDEMREKMYKCV